MMPKGYQSQDQLINEMYQLIKCLDSVARGEQELRIAMQQEIMELKYMINGIKIDMAKHEKNENSHKT